MASSIPTVNSSSKKTMFNYFEKLPSRTSITVDETNPRKDAPVFNKQHVDEFQARIEQFDTEIASSNNTADPTTNTHYLIAIKSKQHTPYRWPKSFRGRLRARLLQFKEDVRPPYFGTWQKKSKTITGRKPFGLDTEVFDYEYDSEAEWEIGGPGESLKGDDSDDEEELDDYEIDMKTFVPHGYVGSDEEGDEDSEDKVNKVTLFNTDENRAENSDDSIKIVAEVKVQQAQPQHVKKTPQMELEPKIFGLNFVHNSPTKEEKQQFLIDTFPGYCCETPIKKDK